MTAPKDITVDTTIEEIWDGFFTQVIKNVDRDSEDYDEARMLFFAGATGALRWLVIASEQGGDMPTLIAERERELDDAMNRYIAKRRAEQSS